MAAISLSDGVLTKLVTDKDIISPLLGTVVLVAAYRATGGWSPSRADPNFALREAGEAEDQACGSSRGDEKNAAAEEADASSSCEDEISHLPEGNVKDIPNQESAAGVFGDFWNIPMLRKCALCLLLLSMGQTAEGRVGRLLFKDDDGEHIHRVCPRRIYVR